MDKGHEEKNLDFLCLQRKKRKKIEGTTFLAQLLKPCILVLKSKRLHDKNFPALN